MKASRSIASLVTTLILTSTCVAVDLRQINRTIKKEPTYKNRPAYCLIVFGSEAKTRVWMVRDGDVLYVDRNGNGDLTEKGKQVKATYERIGKESVALVPELAKVRIVSFNIGEIIDPESKTKYTKILAGFFPPEMLPSAEENTCQVYCDFEGKHFIVGFPQGNFRFADKREEAPILHFGGPLTFGLLGLPELPGWRGDLTLTGGVKTQLDVYLGTCGLGKGAFAFVSGRVTNKPFDMSLDQCGIKVPGEVDPKVEIELASRDAAGQPVKIHTWLSRRDCGNKTFAGFVRIPKEAGKVVGKAKITVSFPDSKTPLYVNGQYSGDGFTRVSRVGKVVPATFEVPIVGSK